MTIPPSFSCENATSLYTREAFSWFSFYYLVSSFLIVGTGVLDGPFIKISLCFARTTGGRPYRRYVVLSLLNVGDDILGVPFIKISLRFARTTGGRPYRFVRDLIFCS